MSARILKRASVCVLCLATASPLAQADPPRVVASITPIHSLVAGVMDGLAEPALIVKGYHSPHTYQMRPSDAARLNNADIVFWVGETMETFLKKPLASLGEKVQVVALIETSGLALLPNRKGGAWPPRHNESDGAQRHQHAGHGNVDPHVWLDPDNAKRLLTEIVARVSKADPANAAAYQANAEQLAQRIEAMDQKLRAELAPVSDLPYLVFHDAFQYFEHHYGLNAIGSITVSPDRRPGARRLTELRAKIKDLNARCVFHEPQFESPLVATIIEDTDTGRGIIDPLGAERPPGPNAYFDMMQTNATALIECLTK